MPTIVREDHDDLHVTLTVNVPKVDYEPIFQAKLKEYGKTASLKGFRKGQIPLSVIRKMFGKGALVEVINSIVDKELNDYLKTADFEIMAQPLPVDQVELSLNTKELQDYSLKFDLGLVPNFEIKGLDDNAFNIYNVTIPDSMVEEDLANALKKSGERLEVEDELQEGDVFKISAVELSGPLPKEDGLTPTFSVSFDELALEIKEVARTKKKGDSFRFDIFKLVEGKTEAFVKRYLLGLNPDADEDAVYGNDFEGTITEVMRVVPAQLNQDFFDKAFGPNSVTSEEEAKAKIKNHIKLYYDSQADGLLYGDILQKLRADNKIVLPNLFLEKWLANGENIPEGTTAKEQLEKLYPSFQWDLVSNKLAKRFDLVVSEQEIKLYIRTEIIQQLGGYDYGDMLDGYVDLVLKDDKQVNNAYSKILYSKLFMKIKKIVTLNEIPISKTEFEEILKAEQEK